MFCFKAKFFRFCIFLFSLVNLFFIVQLSSLEPSFFKKSRILWFSLVNLFLTVQVFGFGAKFCSRASGFRRSDVYLIVWVPLTTILSILRPIFNEIQLSRLIVLHRYFIHLIFTKSFYNIFAIFNLWLLLYQRVPLV